MATELHIKSGGAWRKAKEVHVKSGGTWRKCKEVWIKAAGTWQKVFSSGVSMVAGTWGGGLEGYLEGVSGSMSGTVAGYTIYEFRNDNAGNDFWFTLRGVVPQNTWATMRIVGSGVDVTLNSADVYSFYQDNGLVLTTWNYSGATPGQLEPMVPGQTYTLTFT
jgi:hypothetical protein